MASFTLITPMAYGFIENLQQGADWNPAAGPAAVLGAGGAARAVYRLLDAGVPEILTVEPHTRPRRGLQRRFGKRLSVVDWVQAGNMLEDARRW